MKTDKLSAEFSYDNIRIRINKIPDDEVRKRCNIAFDLSLGLNGDRSIGLSATDVVKKSGIAKEILYDLSILIDKYDASTYLSYMSLNIGDAALKKRLTLGTLNKLYDEEKRGLYVRRRLLFTYREVRYLCGIFLYESPFASIKH